MKTFQLKIIKNDSVSTYDNTLSIECYLLDYGAIGILADHIDTVGIIDKDHKMQFKLLINDKEEERDVIVNNGILEFRKNKCTVILNKE